MLLGNEQMNEGGILILFYHKVMFFFYHKEKKRQQKKLRNRLSKHSRRVSQYGMIYLSY